MAGRGTKLRLLKLEPNQRRRSWSIAKCLGFLLQKSSCMCVTML